MKSTSKERKGPRLDTTSWALPTETSISQAGTCQSPFEFRVIDKAEHLLQQLQVTTLPNHCHFSWRRKSLVKGQATTEKFHFQHWAVQRSCGHEYFWPEILLPSPELPRTQAVVLAQGRILATMAILPRGSSSAGPYTILWLSCSHTW